MKKNLLIAAMLLTYGFAQAQTPIVVDPNARQQTMKGFGVSLCWWANLMGNWGDPTITDICTSLTDPNELNLNLFRFNIGGGDDPAHHHMRTDGGNMPGYKPTRAGSYDWTADANQRTVLKKLYALKPGAIYEAFSNAPPYWMSNNGCSAGNGGSDNLKSTDFGTFSDYLTEVVKHYHDVEGVTFSKLEPFNECFSTWWTSGGNQEGCYFSQASQNSLINSVYSSLSSKGMSYCKLTAMDGNSIDETLSGLNGYVSAGITSKLDFISTHSYVGSQRTALYNAATAQGKEVWQTESIHVLFKF